MAFFFLPEKFDDLTVAQICAFNAVARDGFDAYKALKAGKDSKRYATFIALFTIVNDEKIEPTSLLWRNGRPTAADLRAVYDCLAPQISGLKGTYPKRLKKAFRIFMYKVSLKIQKAKYKA